MEDFYDSLEDNFSSASSSSIPSNRPPLNSDIWETVELHDDCSYSSLIIIKPPEPRIKRHRTEHSISVTDKEFMEKCNTKSKTQIELNNDISSIVPLYEGDKNKSEIRKFKKSTSSPKLTYEEPESSDLNSMAKDDCFHTSTQPKNHRKKRSKICVYKHKHPDVTADTVASKIPLKSYVGMFHARIGYPGANEKKKPEDTIRSICGDSYRSELTEMSNDKDEFVDAEDSRSDTTSFYMNQIEEDVKKKSESSIKSQSFINATSHADSDLSSNTNFTSISEVIKTPNSIRSQKNSKLKKTKTKLLPVPVLGGLGPDIGSSHEKLERRQRQLKYGQKASYRNRIRQMEIKVLKNLKSEIQESNSFNQLHKSE